MKVMIVDDNLEFIKFFSAAAPKEWHLIACVGSVEAIKRLSVDKPDIVISDIMMPGIHGLEFSYIARKACPDVELIFISANPLAQIEDEVGLLPIDALLFQKPLEDSFYEAIEALLRQLQASPKNPQKKLLFTDFYQQITAYHQNAREYFLWMRDVLFNREWSFDVNHWKDKKLQNKYLAFHKEFEEAKKLLNLTDEKDRGIWCDWMLNPLDYLSAHYEEIFTDILGTNRDMKFTCSGGLSIGALRKAYQGSQLLPTLEEATVISEISLHVDREKSLIVMKVNGQFYWPSGSEQVLKSDLQKIEYMLKAHRDFVNITRVADFISDIALAGRKM
jgi:CheY-like chemotaxis protein